MNRVGDNLVHFGANEELVRAFVRNQVEFVVVGGLAVSWYCPSRQADDMDLLVNPTPDNSQRISLALQDLRLTGFDANSFVRQGLQIRIKEHYYAELLTPKIEGPTFAEVWSAAVEAKLFNIPVRLASASTLISMKKQALCGTDDKCDKHREDIECLKQHAA